MVFIATIIRACAVAQQLEIKPGVERSGDRIDRVGHDSSAPDSANQSDGSAKDLANEKFADALPGKLFVHAELGKEYSGNAP